MSAGSFSRTAAGNRAYHKTCLLTPFHSNHCKFRLAGFQKIGSMYNTTCYNKYDTTKGKTLKWECVTVFFFKCNNDSNNANNANDDDDDDDDDNYL